MFVQNLTRHLIFSMCKRDMASMSIEAEKAIAAKEEALRMAAEARKVKRVLNIVAWVPPLATLWLPHCG